MILLFAFLTVVIFALVGYFLFRAGEHHELKRIHGAFERFERNLVSYFEKERGIASHDGVTFGELPKETIQGAGYAVQKMLEMIDKEEAEIDHEFINYFKKVFSDIFHGKE